MSLEIRTTDEAKLTLPQRLGHSSNKRIRDDAFSDLSKWLDERVDVDELEYMKLWKSLYACIYHSDKTFVQQELIRKVASLLRIFYSSKLNKNGKRSLNKNEIDSRFRLFIQCFFQTMLREWLAIDHHRLDKFMSLIRRILYELLFFLYQSDFLSSNVSLVNSLLLDAILTRRPNGIRNHIFDIFVDEIACTIPDISTKQLFPLLHPFFTLLETTDDQVVFDKILKEVFLDGILETLKTSIRIQEGIEEMEAAVAAEKERAKMEKERMKREEERAAKKPKKLSKFEKTYAASNIDVENDDSEGDVVLSGTDDDEYVVPATHDDNVTDGSDIEPPVGEARLGISVNKMRAMAVEMSERRENKRQAFLSVNVCSIARQLWSIGAKPEVSPKRRAAIYAAHQMYLDFAMEHEHAKSEKDLYPPRTEAAVEIPSGAGAGATEPVVSAALKEKELAKDAVKAKKTSKNTEELQASIKPSNAKKGSSLKKKLTSNETPVDVFSSIPTIGELKKRTSETVSEEPVEAKVTKKLKKKTAKN
jgi:ribosomal RNA-processing protein 1